VRNSLPRGRIVRRIILHRQQLREQLLLRVRPREKVDQLETGHRAILVRATWPHAVDSAVVVRLGFFDPSLLFQHARHREIRRSVVRISFQQRQQHLLGVGRPVIGENCLGQSNAVCGIIGVERRGGTEVFYTRLDASLRDQFLARGEFARRVYLALPDVHGGESGVEQEQPHDRGQDDCERCDELGQCGRRNRGRLNRGGFHRSGCSL
jgi:hypothetical protein